MDDLRIKVSSDRGPIEARWTMVNEAKELGSLQTSVSLDWSLTGFTEIYTKMQRDKWHKRWGLGVYKIPDDSTVIEIGCGIGTAAILAAKYLPQSQHHLIDADEVNTGFGKGSPLWTTNGSVLYNTWDVVANGIESSGIDPQRFEFNTLGRNPWPAADMIMSHASWCYHYPTEVYLDKVVSSLKPGGILCVTIRFYDKDDALSKISERLGGPPRAMLTYDKAEKPGNFGILTDRDFYKADCVWVKE